MADKGTVTIIYDAVEDEEKAKADSKNQLFPLVYEQVAAALKELQYTVRLLPADCDILELAEKINRDDCDVFFNLCESINGNGKDEPRMAAMLELFGKPFTGSGSIGITLAQDKSVAKKLLEFHEIKTPRFCTLDSGRVEWSDRLSFPVIVKPLGEDASIGIDKNSVVHDIKELLERISMIHESVGAPALVEEFIDGREIYIGVIGTTDGKLEALPVLEWDLSRVKDGPKIASAEAKWDTQSDGFKAPQLFPSDIPEEVVTAMKEAAVTAVQILKLRDYARVDIRLRSSGNGTGKTWQFYVLEVNPNPYLEQQSEFCMASLEHGLPHPVLLERIIELARRRGSTLRIQTSNASPDR